MVSMDDITTFLQVLTNRKHNHILYRAYSNLKKMYKHICSFKVHSSVIHIHTEKGIIVEERGIAKPKARRFAIPSDDGFSCTALCMLGKGWVHCSMCPVIRTCWLTRYFCMSKYVATSVNGFFWLYNIIGVLHKNVDFLGNSTK